MSLSDPDRRRFDDIVSELRHDQVTARQRAMAAHPAGSGRALTTQEASSLRGLTIATATLVGLVIVVDSGLPWVAVTALLALPALAAVLLVRCSARLVPRRTRPRPLRLPRQRRGGWPGAAAA